MRSVASPDQRSDEAPVENLLAEARHADNEPLGRLLQLYQNCLTVLATTQINPRFRCRMAPSGSGSRDDAHRASRLRELSWRI
ncbi:MAG: hypothetical protein CMJ64_08805 [Planctomycetaceae bacterium]|nr:hypothetical protein [Planctomycetaceae bacterium]